MNSVYLKNIYYLLPLFILPKLILIPQHQFGWDDSSLFRAAAVFSQNLFNGNFASAYNSMNLYKSPIVCFFTLPIGHFMQSVDTFYFALLPLNILTFLMFCAVVFYMARLNVDAILATIFCIIVVTMPALNVTVGYFIPDIVFVFALVAYILGLILFSEQPNVKILDLLIFMSAIFFGILSKFSFLLFLPLLIPLLFIRIHKKFEISCCLWIAVAVFLSLFFLYPSFFAQIVHAKVMSLGIGREAMRPDSMLWRIFSLLYQMFRKELLFIIMAFVIFCVQRRLVLAETFKIKHIAYSMYTYCLAVSIVYFLFTLNSRFVEIHYLLPMVIVPLAAVASLNRCNFALSHSNFAAIIVICGCFLLTSTPSIYDNSNLKKQMHFMDRVDLRDDKVLLATDTVNFNRGNFYLSSYFSKNNVNFDLISTAASGSPFDEYIRLVLNHDVVLFAKPLPVRDWSRADIPKIKSTLEKDPNFVSIEDGYAYVFVKKGSRAYSRNLQRIVR